jgi:hypothetical protein
MGGKEIGKRVVGAEGATQINEDRTLAKASPTLAKNRTARVGHPEPF